MLIVHCDYDCVQALVEVLVDQTSFQACFFGSLTTTASDGRSGLLRGRGILQLLLVFNFHHTGSRKNEQYRQAKEA